MHATVQKGPCFSKLQSWFSPLSRFFSSVCLVLLHTHSKNGGVIKGSICQEPRLVPAWNGTRAEHSEQHAHGICAFAMFTNPLFLTRKLVPNPIFP